MYRSYSQRNISFRDGKGNKCSFYRSMHQMIHLELLISEVHGQTADTVCHKPTVLGTIAFKGMYPCEYTVLFSDYGLHPLGHLGFTQAANLDNPFRPLTSLNSKSR